MSEAVALRGGAGRRRYWRVLLANERTAVLMHACPEDAAILPPALRDAGVPIPFVPVTDFLRSHGLPVPDLYGVREGERWVLLEDLGDRHLSDLDATSLRERRREAVELLARAHAIPRDAGALPFRRRFDAEWVSFELDLFLDRLASRPFYEELRQAFVGLACAISELPTTLCLRDYQSHNLMIDPRDRLRVLDYQDALEAPPELDLAALLFDSYVPCDAREREELLARYERAGGRPPQAGSLARLVVQRKCKDLSRFLMLAERGDARFVEPASAARSAVLGALPDLPAEHSGLAKLLEGAVEELAA